MRGIVAELNGKKAIILAQDGSFRKIKAARYMTVGSEIDLNQSTENAKVTRLITRVASIAAVALFTLGIGYGAYSYTVPYSFVDIDINPSIELTTNIFDRIIKVEALNEDGKKLLNNSNLKNASLEAGISHLINSAIDHGYLKSGSVSPARSEPVSGVVIENAMIITVSSDNRIKSGELKKEVVDAASKELDKGNINSEILVAEATVKQRDDARMFGVTPGKLTLIEDAMEDEPELKLEDLKKAAVRDLIKNAKDKEMEKNRQKAAKENGSDIITSSAIDPKEEDLQSKQDGDQEQTAVLEQDQKQVDSGKNNDMEQNKEVVKQDNNGSQNIADILKKEKQQRQKLRDELLKQVKDYKQEQDNTQQIKEDNDGTKQNNDKSNTSKGKKGTSQQK